MWNSYQVELTATRLTGGFPANPRLIESWLSSKKAPKEALDAAKVQLERLAEIDLEETHMVVFWRDRNLVAHYESRAFKAALKEGANILKGMLDVKNFRARLAERVFVDPRIGGCEIRCRCGEAHHPEDFFHVEERPIQVMTMQGPRTSIKRVEYALEVPISFRIRVLNDGVIQESQLKTILEYLQDNGIGADRSQGSGTYSLERFEPIGD
jgi:hypothetical protein